MADNGAPPSTASLYGGGRGGGKMKRAKKPPATPYDRPNRGWLSRAKGFIAGGASYLPSFFYSSSTPAEEVRPDEEVQPDVEHTTEELNENIAVNTNTLQLLSSASNGGVGPSAPEGNLDADMSTKARAEKREHFDGSLPDIEQLIKGNTFSRQEIDHLVDILRSRVVNVEPEGKAPSFTEMDEIERARISKGKQKASVIENEEIDRFQMASTPLPKLSLQGEVGASPIDIARAYMGSRTSEVGLTSPSLTLKNEKWPTTSEFTSKPIMPSPLSRAQICWPGAVTQNQQGYSTPQNSKSGYGLQSFPRTPYSRTIFSKSKSKLTPLRGDGERLSNILSTPLPPKETPVYGKSISNASRDIYGTGGPIRRTRTKFTSAAPVKESPSGRSIHRSPFSKEFNSNNMTKNNSELGSLSSNFEPSNRKVQNSEVAVPSAHPHSSKLARQILEQIDRPVTLKEKSTELKAASLFKNTPSDKEVSNADTVGIAARKNVDLFSTKPYSRSNGIYGSARENTDIANSHTGKDDVADGNIGSASRSKKLDSGTSSPEKTNISRGGESNILETPPNSSKFEPLNGQRKPSLPSIAVGKSGLRNSFSSDTSVAFSFPVTSSSNTYFDLPTPTVMPSSLTSSPQKQNVSPPDSKITIAPPVFSLSPTETASALTDDVASKFKFGSGGTNDNVAPKFKFMSGPTSDDVAPKITFGSGKTSENVAPKFKFGTGKTRLSFASQEDDSIPSSDLPTISYKFGSGKSRLNFGSITASAAGC